MVDSSINHVGDDAPDQQPTPSPHLPVLVAVLVCDAAVAEPSTGKKTLVGIFDRIHALSFPTKRPLSIYVKLMDAEGFYRMMIRMVHLDSGTTVAEVHAEFSAPNRLHSIDGVTPSVPFLFMEPGRYEFQVHANDVFLGSAIVDAAKMAGGGP